MRHRRRSIRRRNGRSRGLRRALPSRAGRCRGLRSFGPHSARPERFCLLQLLHATAASAPSARVEGLLRARIGLRIAAGLTLRILAGGPLVGSESRIFPGGSGGPKPPSRDHSRVPHRIVLNPFSPRTAPLNSPRIRGCTDTTGVFGGSHRAEVACRGCLRLFGRAVQHRDTEVGAV